MKKKIGILIGNGENCTCADCPVLYGGECLTTEENNAKLKKQQIKKKKRKKIRVFCRLYKYICAACGRKKHMRHSILPGQICPSCMKDHPNENQIPLFENSEKIENSLITNH